VIWSNAQLLAEHAVSVLDIVRRMYARGICRFEPSRGYVTEILTIRSSV